MRQWNGRIPAATSTAPGHGRSEGIDMAETTRARPKLAALINAAVDSAAFRFRDAERAAEVFEFATHEDGKHAWRCNACGWRGVELTTEQLAIQEAARHIPDCPDGWLLSAYAYVDGTWRLLSEVACG